MKEEVTLNVKEQKRLLVLNEVLAGRMTGQEVTDMLGVTLQHTRRLMARYRQKGAVGLAGGNRPLVVRAYEQCRRILAETSRLYQRITAGESLLAK